MICAPSRKIADTRLSATALEIAGTTSAIPAPHYDRSPKKMGADRSAPCLASLHLQLLAISQLSRLTFHPEWFESCVVPLQCRSAADARSSAPGPGSFRSTAPTSRPPAESRTAR